MKIFIRVFTISFICFVMIFSSMVWSFNKFMKDDHPNANIPVVRDVRDDNYADSVIDPELKSLVQQSNRINMVVLGIDQTRSDTMIFASFDPDTKRADMISIPRDTYYPRAGYNAPAKKKINSTYGDHGAQGVKSVVSDLLFGIPVDYYITLDYKGVASIVDGIKGVPVYIPQRMKYDDPYDKPPLHIDFAKGNHVLMGEDAVKFLRYRQANSGSGAMNRNGDLGRIQAQQEFIKAAMQKALTIGKIPTLASNAFRFVRTDIEVQDVTKIASKIVGLDSDNIKMHTLPGVPSYQGGASYFFHNVEDTKGVLVNIYSKETVTETTEN